MLSYVHWHDGRDGICVLTCANMELITVCRVCGGSGSGVTAPADM